MTLLISKNHNIKHDNENQIRSGMQKNRARTAEGILTLQEIRSLEIAGVGPPLSPVCGRNPCYSDLPSLVCFCLELEEVLSWSTMEVFWDCFLSNVICHGVHLWCKELKLGHFWVEKLLFKESALCVCVHAHVSWCCVQGCNKVRKSRVFGGGFPFTS